MRSISFSLVAALGLLGCGSAEPDSIGTRVASTTLWQSILDEAAACGIAQPRCPFTESLSGDDLLPNRSGFGSRFDKALRARLPALFPLGAQADKLEALAEDQDCASSGSSTQVNLVCTGQRNYGGSIFGSGVRFFVDATLVVSVSDGKIADLKITTHERAEAF